MESKARFAKQYDPANPRRAKNLDELAWAPLQAAVTSYHELGHSRSQIIQLLEDRHGFSVSPAQLNKQMAQWKRRLKKKDKVSSRTDLVPASIPSNHDSLEHGVEYHHGEGRHQVADNPPLGLEPISGFAASQPEPVDTFPRSSSSASHLYPKANSRHESQRPGATAHLSSSTPEKSSSPSSASHEGSITGNDPSPIPDVSIEWPKDRQDLPSLFELIEKVTEYQPGPDATIIWTNYEPPILPPTACGTHDIDSQWHTTLEFWLRMGNIADALTAAGCLSSAFDLHHICFVQIFTHVKKCGQQIPLSSDLHVSPETQQDAPTRNLFCAAALKSPVLQLLVKAAIGIARSSYPEQAELTRSVLDATLCITNEVESLTTIRFLTALFNCYRQICKLGWWFADTRLFEQITAVGPHRNSIEPNHDSWKLKSLRVIHPTIQNREYLVFISWMSCHSQSSSEHIDHLPSVFGLPTPCTALVADLHSARSPYVCDPGLCSPIENAVITFLDQSYAIISEASPVLERYTKFLPHATEQLENAQFILFWFLTWKRGLLDVNTNQAQCDTDFRPTVFPETAYHPSNLEACYVLCRLISKLFREEFAGEPWWGLMDPAWAPILLSLYALSAIDKIRQSPYVFLHQYLSRVLNPQFYVGYTTNDYKQVHSTILAPPFVVSKVKATLNLHELNQSGDDIDELDVSHLQSRMEMPSTAAVRFELADAESKTNKASHVDPTGINNGRPKRSDLMLPPPRPISPPTGSVITSSSGLSDDTKSFRRLARRINMPGGALAWPPPDHRRDQNPLLPSPRDILEDVIGMPREPPAWGMFFGLKDQFSTIWD
ncbi:hypothetical protein AYL99_07645 [Fonsecaea erecta]|uniref:Clr5 domain-containing protein n=1 Tax=Fonsecaea erecta TaxID=1367422 RepID=A0A178ZHR6_9EURO|nr:hypothetical protein AYL99_07645 [Fonsecaea erecta]OAP58555.1 hypothetical protein AYL99_07645 [Fonsecaea erecta]